MLNCFRTCPQQFYNQYVRRIISKGTSIHLVAGGAFARGLEVARRAFHEHKSSVGEAEALGLAALWQAYGDPVINEKDKKTWDRVSAAYESYLSTYPLDGDFIQVYHPISGMPCIEFTFCVPLPDVLHPVTAEPILLSGRADWIGQYETMPFIVDEKTTGSFSFTWADSWDLWAQFSTYVYAARYYGIPVKGSIVRGTAILKEEIQHKQAIIYQPEWKLDRWYEQTCRDLNRMIQAWIEDYWDFNLGDSCKSYGGCPYAELCKRQNPEPWISIYYEENTWNPLQKTSPFLLAEVE
ncbi:MAG TPA: PD-(D/E)XK nuclease family protein [Dissulfurispiraceae bacterium]|nr:PD-(D/E)XK nuclease family protein [Dissulfurispiraceae bacterium]